MSTIQEQKDRLSKVTQEAGTGEVANPANKPAIMVTGRNRIPLSIPRLKLAAPKIPGFVLQWFADRPGRIQAAQEGGFEFVGREEVLLNSLGVADPASVDGNSDLGSRVSVYGGIGEGGSSERLYLMKIREEWYKEDQKVIADRNEGVAEAIRGGNDLERNPNEVGADTNLRYVKGGAPKRARPNMFNQRKQG